MDSLDLLEKLIGATHWHHGYSDSVADVIRIIAGLDKNSGTESAKIQGTEISLFCDKLVQAEQIVEAIKPKFPDAHTFIDRSFEWHDGYPGYYAVFNFMRQR